MITAASASARRSVRLTLFGTFAPLGEFDLALDENWAALAPELLWSVWGGALKAATLAYYRRRGACSAPDGAKGVAAGEG